MHDDVNGDLDDHSDIYQKQKRLASGPRSYSQFQRELLSRL